MTLVTRNCFHFQDLFSNSPYYLPYNSYDVSSENLVLDQLILCLMISLFIVITCLADIVLILYAEIPSDHLWEFWGLRLNIWAQLTPHNWNLTLTQITTDLLLIFFILTSTVIVPNKSKPKFKVIFLCQVLQCTILVNNSNPFVKVHCSVLFKSVVLFLLLTKHYPIF